MRSSSGDGSWSCSATDKAGDCPPTAATLASFPAPARPAPRRRARTSLAWATRGPLPRSRSCRSLIFRRREGLSCAHASPIIVARSISEKLAVPGLTQSAAWRFPTRKMGMAHVIGTFHAQAAIIAIALVVTSATAARADCISGNLEQVTPQAAAVSSTEARTYFVQGAEKTGCPPNDTACRAHAFVVPNDAVLLTKVVGDYACALLTNSKGTTTENWLPA